MNQSGDIVGYSTLSGDQVVEPTFWSMSTGLVEIGNLGMDGGITNAVNASGLTVGRAPVDERDYHAYVWSLANGIEDLGTPGVYSSANDINDGNSIVGYTYDWDTQLSTAILWTSDAPAITSVDHTTFTEGSFGTFTVTTTGNPTPSIFFGCECNPLPSGVDFNDNGDGTATLSGTPDAGTADLYSLPIEAANGVSPNASQDFQLTVAPAELRGPDPDEDGLARSRAGAEPHHLHARRGQRRFGRCQPAWCADR